ncbi:pentatricopeptide repeat-containing protein At2g37320 [Ipomoea triloba]|uniref:pentatricopeptide repeat-containing protein At2g37320 n=1 Tax=Ipomoea triloba TaxID=35885 RepID=UPI00125DF0D3|nr:pentatricopeptide repeat-containing protein At2g37320 [Ipomoea triloba]XP_031111541.1 pentatricopeptide repeat-containing protein At2g37320 [Ipomoea triloba]XP_031111542.1 pentatricopeptide repeat-containing protein At2g37320 [Ipomoea triloba]
MNRKRLIHAISERVCSANQSPFLPHTLFSCGVDKFSQPRRLTRRLKPPRFLDIIKASKPNVTGKRGAHLRLIEEFLQTDISQLDWHRSGEENSIELLSRLHRQGLRTDPSVLSNALSSCASERAVSVGIQIHCLVMVNGFLSNVYVGSSLITLYAKCGVAGDAYKVFEEMPVKNVVSWTAVVHGFSLEFQVDVCLQLYREMRTSALMPNEFTFTSLLSASTGSGCFGQARSVHCQTICMGLDSHLHVANALIAMYCKGGEIEDAHYVFQKINGKDLVSWNTMIAGYAHHGLAPKAIELFEQMKDQKVKPDSITFLGILSACRHAGLVKHGWFYFDSMACYDVKPELDHFSCIIDLLGRAGRVEEARNLIKEMPVKPNGIIWGSLLMSSRLHGKVEVGIEAAENRLMLEPWCTATHLQLANLYASIGLWDQAARVRKAMKNKGLKSDPGYSWIEIRNEVHYFRVEDRSLAQLNEIVPVMDILADHMRDLGEEEIDCSL